MKESDNLHLKIDLISSILEALNLFHSKSSIQEKISEICEFPIYLIIIYRDSIEDDFTIKYSTNHPQKEFILKNSEKFIKTLTSTDNDTHYFNEMENSVLISSKFSSGYVSFFAPENLKSDKELKNAINLVAKELDIQLNPQHKIENKYANIFETSSAGIILCKFDGTIVEINTYLLNLIEHEKDEILNHKVFDFIPDFDNNRAMKIVEDIIQNEKLCFEGYLLRKDKSILTVRISTNIITFENEKFIQAVVTDTTEHKKILEKLKDSEEKYKALFFNAPLAFQSLNENGCFIDINPMWSQILGYERDEVIGKWFGDFLEDEYMEHFKKRFPQFKKEGVVHDVRFKMKHKKGRTITVSFEGCIGYDDKGNFKQTYCTFKDISSEINALEQLEQSEERYRQIFSSSSSTMLIIEPLSGKIIDANKAAVKFYGYTIDELKNMKISDINILSEEEIEKAIKIAALEKKQYFTFKHKLKNGKVKPVEVYSGKVSFHKKTYLLSIIHNIEDKVKAENALKDSEEKFRKYIESSTVAVYIVDETGKYKYVNPAACKLTGHTSEDLLKMRIPDLTYDQNSEIDLKSFDKLKRTENRIHYITKLRKKDNSPISVSLSAVKLDKTSFIGFCIDMSTIVKYQEELELKEKHFESLLNNPENYIIYRLEAGKSPIDAKVTHVSPSVKNLLGVSDDEMYDFKKWLNHVHPADLPKIIKANENGTKPPFKFKEIFRYTHPHKGEMWLRIESTGIPYKNNPEQIEYANGIITDITDIKTLQEKFEYQNEELKMLNYELEKSIEELRITNLELERSKEIIEINELKYRTIFEGAPLGIFRSTKQGKFIEVNKALADMLGYDTPEDVLKNIDNIAEEIYVDPPKRKEVIKSTNYNDISIFENKYKKKNGDIFYANLYLRTILDEKGESILEGIVEDITTSKLYEKELETAKEKAENSEKRIRALLKAIPDIMFTFRKDGTILDIQAKDEDDLTAPAEDFIGENIDNVFPDYLALVTRNCIERVLKTKKIENYSYTIKFNNSDKFFDARMVYIDKETTLSIVRNMTSRQKMIDKLKAAKKEAEENEKKYSLVVNNASEGIIVVTEKNKFVYANPSILEMTGYSPKDIKNVTFADVIHPDDFIKVIENSKKRLDGAYIPIYDFRIIRKDGEYRWFSINATKVDWYGENAILCFVTDITERKNAEIKLKENEKMLSDAQKVARIGHYDFDLSSDYWSSSETLNKIFGIDDTYSKDYLAWLNIIHPDDKDKMNKYFLEEVLEKNNSFDKEYRILRVSDKKTLWVHGLGDLVRDEKGNPINLFGTIQDITDRKLAEIEHQALLERVRRSQKLETIGTLAGGIAHDFNNILTPIFGYSTLAIERLEDNSELKEYLEDINIAASRARDLVKQILTFSRQVEHKMNPLDLQSVIKEVMKLLRPSIPSTIKIKQEFEEKNSTILADLSQIHQIIMNLATNAFHAMEKDGGTLTIKLKNVVLEDDEIENFQNLTEAGEYLCLCISDTGEGMNSETLDRIFEPFFTTKEVGKGTGLGLSVVHGIVKTHNGEIVINSELGKGTNVSIYFPVQNDSKNITREESFMPSKGSESILIVDDEVSITKMLQKLLQKFGYMVNIVNNSKEAIGIFKAAPEQFDLIITDLTMPDVTGLDLAKEFQEIKKGIPIILISGYATDITKETMNMYNIKEIMVKPLILKELTAKIRNILDTNQDD